MDSSEYLKKYPNKLVDVKSNHTIEKVWGEEHVICNYEGMVGKLMVLKPRFASSVHMHPGLIEVDGKRGKWECFYVIEGEVLIYLVDSNTGRGEWKLLKVGDIIEIGPNMPHRFLSVDGAKFIEFSYNHDKSDGSQNNFRFEPSRLFSDDEILRIMEHI